MSEESLDRRLQSLLKQGRKIEAIKLCKDELKIEFDEARQYIDEMIQQIESDLKLEPASNDTHAAPIKIQTTNLEPLNKSIEDSVKNTSNEKSEILNTQLGKNETDQEKTKKDDNKISLKTKIIVGLVILVILKGCSYHHYSTGGDNSGSKLSKLLYWIADTVIPWPETPRPENEVSNESDNNETDGFESYIYSQPEATDDADDLKDSDNSETESAETQAPEDTYDTESSSSSQDEVNNSKSLAPITIENVEDSGSSVYIVLSNGKTFRVSNCARCSLIGWSGAAIIFLQDNGNSNASLNRLIINPIDPKSGCIGGVHSCTNMGYGSITLCRECQFKSVTQNSVVINDGYRNKIFDFKGNIKN